MALNDFNEIWQRDKSISTINVIVILVVDKQTANLKKIRYKNLKNPVVVYIHTIYGFIPWGEIYYKNRDPLPVFLTWKNADVF